MNFSPENFTRELTNRAPSLMIRKCPICGGNKFTSTDSFASILIGKEMNTINIGPSIPAGMIVCEQCGHIDFFALGVLGLLSREEENVDK